MRDLIRQKIVDAMASSVPAFTRRDVHIPSVRGKAFAVIGMRRTGKSTLLWQIASDRFAKGTEREGVLFFTFEDERLAVMTTADLDLVVEEYYRLYPQWRDKRRATFLLDEVQVVEGWEMFARRLLDSENVELFLSGSSARLLSREVATSMRGRAMEVLVHPFSFREFLRHQEKEPTNDLVRIPKAGRSALDKSLRLYLAQGGFPETIGLASRDRFNLLRGYVDTALLRDVIERHQVSHPVALRWMVRHLLANAAGTFSVNKFYGNLRSQGIPVAKDTLHEYLGHLEDAFLVRTVSLASSSERRRMVNPRKIYPVDSGLIPLFDRTARANVGHALETCVLIELERRGAEISYVRNANGTEVDFFVRFPNGTQELIQVCTELTSATTREREIGALLEARKEYKRVPARLITLEPVDHNLLPKGVRASLALEWLLSDSGKQ